MIRPFIDCKPIEKLQSPFSRLFIAIQERIKECVPAIQWCDQWYGQEQFDYRPGVAFPALLIDFPNTYYSNEAAGSQFCEITITLRLLFAPFSSSAATAPSEARADAMNCYELECELVAALQDWTPAGNFCQSLIRTQAQTENQHPEYRVRLLTFTTAYEEDVKQPPSRITRPVQITE